MHVGPQPIQGRALHEAAEVIQRVVDPDANIIFGMTTDLKMENEVKLTIIATGFPTPDNIETRESHITKFLDEALITSGDVEIDVPPFLRRLSRRSNKPTETTSKNPDAEIETEVA